MKYNVEVGASNKITKEFNTLNEICEFLLNCQGQVSIVETYIGHEIFNGPVDTWLRLYAPCIPR